MCITVQIAQMTKKREKSQLKLFVVVRYQPPACLCLFRTLSHYILFDVYTIKYFISSLIILFNNSKSDLIVHYLEEPQRRTANFNLEHFEFGVINVSYSNLAF